MRLFRSIRHLLPLWLAFVASTHAASDAPADWSVAEPQLGADPVSAKIDVREGTWMSLDVSPDGRHIVFDLLGDIYEIPITGGKATPLLSGHAWDMQPRYSPDGRHIAFTSDRQGGDNLWLLDRQSGEQRQVTFEDFRLLNNPVWSPDGNYLAARKHFTTSRSLGTGEIWLYHTDGGKGRSGQQVVERPSETFQKEQGEPAFSPDGRFLYFTLNVTPGDTFIYHQDSNTELFQIRRVELATGEVSTVAGGPGGAVRPTPSPDGKRLAYVKRVRAESRLFVMDLDSGVERMVYPDLDLDMQETWAVQGLYPNMAWTPDSRELVFWAGGKLWRLAVDNGLLQDIPFHVQDTRSLYPPIRASVEVAPDSFPLRMLRFASPSPDGGSVVFEALGQLYLQRGEDAPEPLTRDRGDGFDYAPVWSPDGKSVYFLRWQDDKLTSVRRVSARGGKSTALEHPRGQYVELAIDRDGQTLALRKLAGNALLHPDWGVKPGLYLLDIEGGELRFVSQRGRHPHFGPDSTRLYAQERAETATGRGSSTAKTRLISMQRDGQDVRALAEADFATRIMLSPTGRHIAFENAHHLHLAEFTPSGKPLVLDAAEPAFPVVRVSETGGAFPGWNQDGSAVHWSTGPNFKQLVVDTAMQPGFSPADPSRALEVSVEHAAPESRLALTGARIATMDENRRVIENGTLLVQGNRIQAVGDADLAIPAGYTRVDLAGSTVVPGFVDAHAHGPYGHEDIIPQKNWNLLAHLALGVTTLHDPSSRAAEVFAAAEYARAGRILSPRIFSTAEIIYGAKSTYWSPVDTLDDALAHARRLKAQGAISVKNYNQPRREQRQQVNAAARREGLLSVAEGGSLYHMDMSLIADGVTGIEHNIPVLNLYEDVMQFWRQSGAGYTPTQVVSYGGLTAEDYYYQHTEVWKHPILSHWVPPRVLQPRSVRRPMAPAADYRDDEAAQSARALLQAGIRVNTGGHGQREGLATHWEMWSFVRGGFTPMEALAAATINPAHYLGMQADLGSLEAGKLADLVVIDGNPLADIRQSDKVTRVMLNGRLYDARTLEEEVTGEAELAPLYWQEHPAAQIR
tara:strand:+ start:25835 stop:29074 length:3240 start_codon:yes stop_codon:yes gene_type:complete